MQKSLARESVIRMGRNKAKRGSIEPYSQVRKAARAMRKTQAVLFRQFNLNSLELPFELWRR